MSGVWTYGLLFLEARGRARRLSLGRIDRD